MAQLVQNTYANALLELALEDNKLDIYQDKAKMLLSVFDENKDFRTVIEHPEISKADKLKLLVSAVGDDVSDNFAGLFNVVLNKNRESELYNIIQSFIDKADAHKGIVYAKVYTASDLDEVKLSVIKQKLEQNLKKDVILEVSKDSGLIAGMKIIVDGHIIDGTVKKDIDALRKNLYSLELS